MKKFKVFCVLLLVAYLASAVYDFCDAWMSDESVSSVNVHQMDLSGGAFVLRGVLDMVGFATIIFSGVLLVMFVRMMVMFTRQMVFDRRSVRLLSRIGWGCVGLSVVVSLWALDRYLLAGMVGAEAEVNVLGMFDLGNLITGLTVLVMNEILKQALLMKEENDLTI